MRLSRTGWFYRPIGRFSKSLTKICIIFGWSGWRGYFYSVVMTQWRNDNKSMKLYAYRVCARGTRRVYRNHCHCVIVSPFLCMCLCSFIPRCKGTKFLGEMQVFPNLFCSPFLPRGLCVNSKRIMRANSSNSACKLFGCRLQSNRGLRKWHFSIAIQ